MSDAGILKNKVAVVVGSTSGIGETIAREFSAQGAKVVLSGRRAERGQSIIEEILAAGGEAAFIRTDVSIPVDIERLIASAVSRFGALDILVNNAALELTRPLAECTAEDFDRVINTNLRSYFLASVHALKIMTQQRRGVILNVNSVTAEHPAPGIGLYSMAKGAVRQLTRTLALENAHLGIRANEINPGLIQTEIFNDPTAAKVAEFGVSQTPIGRIGTAEECAKAALYLVSDDAGFTTGASLVIDGGLTI